MTEQNKLGLGGVFKFEQIRNGEVIDSWEDKNIVVNEGLNYVLDVALSSGTAIANWYLGVFKNNYTPIAADVAATFPSVGVAGEANSEYSQTTRPQWVDAGASAQSITNTASPAVFTFTSNVTINGGFLISSNVKGGTSGTLMAASKFSAARNLLIGDVLNVSYTINGSST